MEVLFHKTCLFAPVVYIFKSEKGIVFTRSPKHLQGLRLDEYLVIVGFSVTI